MKVQISNNATLTQVVQEYSKLVDAFRVRKRWNEMLEEELWGELCLCILSSNVPYELALSAFEHLRSNQFLKTERIIERPDAAQNIAIELSRQIYSPRRRDGSYRKYRFPNIRATNIVKAAKSLYEEGPELSWILTNCSSEHEVRDLLVENIYGIGLKEASHFLRDIGYSNSLAIIDSHVIAFLAELGVIPTSKSYGVTPGIYTRLERVLQNLCDDLGVNLSIFDMAIWQYMRGRSE